MGMDKIKNAAKSKGGLIAQYAIMALWFAQLINSDAYYVNYLLIAAIAGICCYHNRRSGIFLWVKGKTLYSEVILNLFAVLFSCMISLANYKVWALPEMPDQFGFLFAGFYRIFLGTISFLGGYIAFWHIFHALFYNLKSLIYKKEQTQKESPKMIFFVSFALLVLTRWIVLYFCQYPGELTPDSIHQMGQLTSGVFTNHLPFYHTMVIKFFVNLGQSLFHDINAGVALYSVFQILFTSLCFSFALSTMASMKAPFPMILASLLFFVLMPYHLIYAITMWKDIMFGCFVLLLVLSVYRCIGNLGNSLFNHILFFISGMGVCLFRSNGFFAYAVLFLSFLLLWKAKYRKMLVIFVTVMIASYILKHPVLSMLKVAQPDTIESLSIPAQQISRVVKDGCQLNEREKETLSEIIDIEKIPEAYSPFISDPIKNLVRQKGNQDRIKEEAGKFIRLYASLGIKHPGEYLMGWIDLTRGYWNAGYDYWIWRCRVYDNDLGIEQTVRSYTLNRVLEEYLWLFTDVQLLRLFLSIGLFVWMDMILLLIALLRKDRLGIFVTLPSLALVLSLLIATPVFSELRYMYALFCCLPVIIAMTLRPLKAEETNA